MELKENFNSYEQQMFIASFSCYLTQEKNAFVVDFDTVWEWRGFTSKGNAKRLLDKFFTENKDFVVQKIAYHFGEAIFDNTNSVKSQKSNSEEEVDSSEQKAATAILRSCF